MLYFVTNSNKLSLFYTSFLWGYVSYFLHCLKKTKALITMKRTPDRKLTYDTNPLGKLKPKNEVIFEFTLSYWGESSAQDRFL